MKQETTKIGNHNFKYGIYTEDNGESFYSEIEHLESGLTASLDCLKFDGGFIDETGTLLQIEKYIIESLDFDISDMYETV